MEWIDTWVDMAKHVYHVCSTLRIVFHICLYENMYSRIWAGTFHMACTKPVSSKLPAFALVDSNRAYWKNRVFGFGANLGVWCDTRVQIFFSFRHYMYTIVLNILTLILTYIVTSYKELNRYSQYVCISRTTVLFKLKFT